MSQFYFKNLNKPLTSRKDIVKVKILTKVSKNLSISIEMPSLSKKTLRTYEKRTRSQSKQGINSVQAVNALFAENLKKRLIGKRKKPKLKIKELPSRVTSYLTDESLVKPHFEDTFDRLRKGTVFIKVKKQDEAPLVISSDSEISRLKKTGVQSTNSNSSNKVNSSIFSPIMTRKRMKQRLITTGSSTDQTKSVEAIVESKTKSSDKMPSLSIEGENKKSYHFKYNTLSYIKIPNMRECGVFLDKRCDQLFSESFMERHTVASSTPRLLEAPKRKIVADKISPIVKLHDLRSADLIQKSYDEIRKWDSKFPDVIKLSDTSHKEIISSKFLKRRSKRKLSYVCSPDIENITTDPRLENLPIISLEPNDILFKGYNEKDQNEYQTLSENLKKYISEQSEMIARDRNLIIRQIYIDKKRINDYVVRQIKTSIFKSPTKVNCTESLLNEFELLSDGSIKHHETSNEKSITVDLEDFDIFEASVISVSDDNTAPNHPTPEVSVRRPNIDILHDHSYFNIESSQDENEIELVEDTCELNEEADSDGSVSDCSECSECAEIQENSLVKPIILKAGKKYRRSLNLIRKTMALVQINEVEKHDENCSCWKCILKRKTINLRRSMSMVAIADENLSVLGNFARKSLGYVQEISTENISLEEEQLDESVRNLSLNSSSLGKTNLILSPPPSSTRLISQDPTAKDIVLRRCGQIEPIPFEQCYSPSMLQHCRKIGEGVYGEVFLFRDPNGGTSVMKIMPIEGDLIVNGEHQKKYEEILSEIVIAMELSNLRNCEENKTTAFNEVKRVRCTRGSYPERLLDLWNLYDENGGSENDSPEMFQDNQVFIVLELSNGGEDLESFVFNNAQQAYSMFKQTACALAVAENQLKFEHRDLHWGNILLKTIRTTAKHDYYINGDKFTVDSKGLEVTIIDFTLSRVEIDDVVIFNDLSLDNELFAATGDYQFDIYRLMKKATCNKWRDYQPFTNILWLHYLLDKVPHLRYKNIHSKLHKDSLKKLMKLKENILSYICVTEFVKHNFL